MGATQSNLELEKPWAMEPAQVAERLSCDPRRGLTEEAAARRRRIHGANRLREHKTRSAWRILAEQFRSLIILLLAAAAGVSWAFGEIPETVAIGIVILINTLIGFFTELRAVRSMEALHRMGRTHTRVRRNGEIREIDAADLVPGDVVILEGGDILTADLRILEASKLQADESALTGESMPVGKHAESVPAGTVLAERRGMLYKGTALTRGSGEAVVTATGERTELGQISLMMEDAEENLSPLEQRLDRLGYRLIVLTLVVALLVVLSGVWAGKDLYLMVETGIALAVATIPEGLPIVATLALARGLYAMARRNALVNRLSSVETLGATGMICVDKTGTLTENRMSVRALLLPGVRLEAEGDGEAPFTGENGAAHPERDEGLRRILECGALCNNAALMEEGDAGTGEPMEVALLAAARKAGLGAQELQQRLPEEREEAFDPEVKMMATWNRLPEGGLRVHVKGAPGAVLEACDSVLESGSRRPMDEEERERWLRRNEEAASEGLRLLALASREADDTEGDPYRGLTLLGLVALADPPREDVKEALETCRGAGIRVVMMTGDQPETARYIAEAVGLGDSGDLRVMQGSELPGPGELEASLQASRTVWETPIFARISPRQKLDLISFFQGRGEIVAMTGDGVNDAPALKKADIGIAMGRRGTQVAREAADMVLTDDAFSSIVHAVRYGRVIFGNIRRFIYYLISCNVSEILIVATATLLGLLLPILPLQILFLNLVTDVFPALALGMGEGGRDIMRRPPRKAGESLLESEQWLGIAGYGALITVSVLGALYAGLEWLELQGDAAVTISFLTLATAQLWHVFNMGNGEDTMLRTSVIRNPWVWGALVLCVVLILGAVYLAPVASVLSIVPPGTEGWAVVLVFSLLPLAGGQLLHGISLLRGGSFRGERV